ncbi:MAG: outer membrane protein assembly factor BamC [Proteobacteria bacterium]|jgi:outer membrane protein assembly factor BamC|nr:outer membrane protein assembly factor BamC [Pseudomonadota bacterium]MDA1301499.1 outer membrane protein assembly factor BamC [Pseudomonadota bacterium]
MFSTARLHKYWLAIAAVSLLSGCWFNNSEIRERLETGSSQPVVVPPELDSPDFVNAMPIPVVEDPRGLAERDYKIDLPEPLSTTFGVEKIVIKRLGDQRWVFLDIPPPAVWPNVLSFWEASNLAIEKADPATGIIESTWLPSGSSTGADIFQDIKTGSWLSGKPTQQHKFRLQIEPGVRSGSTEVFLEHRQMSLIGPQRIDNVEWVGESDDDALEAVILTDLAYDLGETIDQSQTISLVAAGLSESRTELVPDRERPVLKYKLDFNRAWATVGAALENARITVEDLDRTGAWYYVYYSSDHNPEPGFMSRLLNRNKKLEPGQANRYLVHLQADDEEIHVTVMKDQDTLADALVAERLLKIIKEYST